MAAAVDDRDDDIPVVLPGLRFGCGHRLLGLIKRYRRTIVTNTFMNGGLRRSNALAAGKFHCRSSPLRPFHSITSSARASSVGAISMPTAFALFRLITISNLVGCSTGSSPGFAPRRILSTYDADRRQRSARLVP